VWGVFLWFALDDFEWYYANPILYPILVIFGSTFAALYKLQLIDVVLNDVFPEVKRKINQVLAMTPLNYRI
jgi:hypothetical protein